MRYAALSCYNLWSKETVMLPPLLTTTDPENYQAYLQQKIDAISSMLKQAVLSTPHGADSGIDQVAIEVHPSIPEHYRMRGEFAVYHHDDDHFDFVMYEKNSKPRKRIVVNEFPGCTVAINQAMALLREFAPGFAELRYKLFEADFLSNQKGEVVISLIYHKPINEALWQAQASEFRKLCAERGLTCSLLAHARKQSLANGNDYVIETIDTIRGPIYLKQVEGTFSQPNATACKAMLNFALSCVQDCANQDLIELYCGSGTFTVTLAPCFRKVFATEVARVPTLTAAYNMALNHITNLKLARLSALEVTEALNGVREFKRLKEQEIDLRTYDFKTLLIDPPRAGLQDEAALSFTAQYDRIIYISCGPEALASDLKYLTKTHRITKLAFFDQFPYTEHLESGVLLERR